jgi:hypothetical protein
MQRVTPPEYLEIKPKSTILDVPTPFSSLRGRREYPHGREQTRSCQRNSLHGRFAETLRDEGFADMENFFEIKRNGSRGMIEIPDQIPYTQT